MQQVTRGRGLFSKGEALQSEHCATTEALHNVVICLCDMREVLSKAEFWVFKKMFWRKLSSGFGVQGLEVYFVTWKGIVSNHSLENTDYMSQSARLLLNKGLVAIKDITVMKHMCIEHCVQKPKELKVDVVGCHFLSLTGRLSQGCSQGLALTLDFPFPECAHWSK